jgi:hypothetical protein
MGRWALALLVVFAVLAAATVWAGRRDEPEARVVTAAGERNGLAARMSLTTTSGSLVVETHVENQRGRPVHLVPDQCGRITEVVLARTRFQPKGRTWSGSLRAVKKYVLADQRLRQHPDRFAPRRPGDTSSNVPACKRPQRPVTLARGTTVDERWELPFDSSRTLDEVGSGAALVRVEVVEARDAAKAEFLDILITGEADAVRAGRRLRLQRPASTVLARAASHPLGPSQGELYDRLLANDTLRTWLGAQPAATWRASELGVLPDGLRFKAITTRYERAVSATARPDGRGVEVRLPTAADRLRVFPRSPATLPPRVRVIAEPDTYTLTDDVLAGKLQLPSGRIVVGSVILDDKPLAAGVKPGAYPLHVTLGRYRRHDFEDVALATLVLSNERTVRWVRTKGIAVDGGTASITSAEGAKQLDGLFLRDEDAWLRQNEEMYDSLTAHDNHVTLFSLDDEANIGQYSSGVGDGVYPVFVGYDSSGRPTRVVVDFYLVHLDWPS